MHIEGKDNIELELNIDELVDGCEPKVEPTFTLKTLRLIGT